MITKAYTNPSPIEDIPDTWKINSVDELCLKVTSGGTPLRANAHFYFNGAINWFKTQELKDWYLYDSEEKITLEAVNNSSAKILPLGTVLMAMYGDGKTITSLGILSKESSCNQACCALIANSEVCDNLFLFYALKFHRADFIHIATGGAQRNLSGALIKNFAIKTPPLNEQKEIAKVLGSLDNKIELNRRMNETLEAMARAIFKSWFVDFDPVRAKANGQQPPGLSAEIAALFPDSFEDTEHTLPTGWKMGTLGDVATHPRQTVNPGDSPPGTPYIGLEHMPRQSIALSEWGVSDDVASNKFAFKKGEILFGKLRPYFHKVGPPVIDGVCSTDIVVVAPKKPCWFSYVLAVVSSTDFVNHTTACSTGTRMPRTNWKDMASYEVTVPPEPVAKAFHNIVEPFVEKIHRNILESKTLAEIRDTLLPKLLSGEVRVSDLNGGGAAA